MGVPEVFEVCYYLVISLEIMLITFKTQRIDNERLDGDLPIGPAAKLSATDSMDITGHKGLFTDIAARPDSDVIPTKLSSTSKSTSIQGPHSDSPSRHRHH